MNISFAPYMLCCIAAIAAAPATAQQGSPIEVTFAVPLNLTRLDSQIPKVRVSCKLYSAAFLGEKQASAEVLVSQGDAVQTVNVVMTFDQSELNNPSGKQAQYACELQGFIPGPGWWKPFCNGCKGGTTESHLQLTPYPAPITGQFVW